MTTEGAKTRGRQAAFGFIYATAVMNALSFGLMIPVLPGLIRSFFGGTDAATTAAAADWQFVFTLDLGLHAVRLRPGAGDDLRPLSAAGR